MNYTLLTCTDAVLATRTGRLVLEHQFGLLTRPLLIDGPARNWLRCFTEYPTAVFPRKYRSEPASWFSPSITGQPTELYALCNRRVHVATPSCQTCESPKSIRDIKLSIVYTGRRPDPTPRARGGDEEIPY